MIKSPRKLKISDLFPSREDGDCRCGCGVKPSGRRTAWASDACVDKALIASGHVQTIRRALRKRDKGVCACCGMDTYAERRKARQLYSEAGGRVTRIFWGGPESDCAKAEAAVVKWRRMGFRLYGPSWWAADHVVALVNGGTHSLDNLQTLCQPCHKIKTKADMIERRATSATLRSHISAA